MNDKGDESKVSFLIYSENRFLIKLLLLVYCSFYYNGSQLCTCIEQKYFGEVQLLIHLSPTSVKKVFDKRENGKFLFFIGQVI